MIIAIDGPAGSGKSSVAREVARRLGLHYLDTGAMYRALAFEALREGIDLSDEFALTELATKVPIEFVHDSSDPLPLKVLVGGRDVTDTIRTPRIDDSVTPVARLGGVRKAMVEQQRALAADKDFVVEGRDIGTVVFPDAALKVFLTASPEERAKRRAQQHAQAGAAVDTERVKSAIERRDAADSSRVHSPLHPAKDAIELDTTNLSLEQVVDRIADLASEARP
jgi:cytidylate kinase